MFRRIALIVVIAGAFSSAMYTSFGCGPIVGESPTEPPTVFAALRGTVTDAQSAVPIAGANVSTLNAAGNSGVSLFTDNAGRYEIFIPVGSTRVTVSRNGYQTFTTTIDLLSSGSTLDIKLQPSP
jgi:hypothetical protein